MDKLISWLNPKGVREMGLKQALEQYRDLIMFNLQKRQLELQMKSSYQEAIATKTRVISKGKWEANAPHMKWENRWLDLK